MISTLLSLDTNLLIAARQLVWYEYASYIVLSSELVVIWAGSLLVGLWLYGVFKHTSEYKITALKIFFLIILVFFIYGIINMGIPQWRLSPAEVVGGIKPLIPHPIDNSFPSGHSLFSAALFVGIWKYLRNSWILWITLVCTLVTTISRVIGGVHYPGDILAGLIFGAIGAILLARVLEYKIFDDKIFPLFLKIASWVKL